MKTIKHLIYYVVTLLLLHACSNEKEIVLPSSPNVSFNASTRLAINDTEYLVNKYVDDQKKILYNVESFITNENTKKNLKNTTIPTDKLNPIDVEFLSMDIVDNETSASISMLDMSSEELNDFMVAYMADRKTELSKKLKENPDFLEHFKEETKMQEMILSKIETKVQNNPATRSSDFNSIISYDEFCEIFYSVNSTEEKGASMEMGKRSKESLSSYYRPESPNEPFLPIGPDEPICPGDPGLASASQ